MRVYVYVCVGCSGAPNGLRDVADAEVIERERELSAMLHTLPCFPLLQRRGDGAGPSSDPVPEGRGDGAAAGSSMVIIITLMRRIA